MDSMLYPTFQPVERRGIIPNIYLPEDYKERIPLFYERKGREKVGYYVNEIQKILRDSDLEFDVRLEWNEILGLTGIQIGMQSGMDLVDDGRPSFQEHNLTTKTGFVGAIILTKYISELLK